MYGKEASNRKQDQLFPQQPGYHLVGEQGRLTVHFFNNHMSHHYRVRPGVYTGLEGRECFTDFADEDGARASGQPQNHIGKGERQYVSSWIMELWVTLFAV